MFPNQNYKKDGISYSAIAELQRIFPQPDDARAAYDCIVATDEVLSVLETRAWVELLMDDADVTRENIKNTVRKYGNNQGNTLNETIRRILNVHDAFESNY